ncbi:hypothetical protein [Sphingomonas faeni]|uniref:hypothetical protein n=1 Tax=Sphingomonas faeni TaxID=185950 RepID=UPI0020C0CAD1|nr:hypothetical protein [Sphingomonas faeni]MCK8457925.1 hypothetical protein [Sphingomonas faeni]
MKSGFRNVAVAVAGAAMMVAPTMVSAANGASSLSVAKARAGTTTTGKSALAEGPTATYVNIGILAALVVGVLLATSGGDDDDGSDSN